MLFVAMLMAMPVTHWQTYNAGVRTGYDAVAKAIGVTKKTHVRRGDFFITSTGIYRKTRVAKKPSVKAGVCLNCHYDLARTGS